MGSQNNWWKNIRSLPYLNDVLVSFQENVVVSMKGMSPSTYISDLVETFANMCEALLTLNPEKCVFGVTRGKL
jgi:hypothetical protein